MKIQIWTFLDFENPCITDSFRAIRVNVGVIYFSWS